MSRLEERLVATRAKFDDYLNSIVTASNDDEPPTSYDHWNFYGLPHDEVGARLGSTLLRTSVNSCQLQTLNLRAVDLLGQLGSTTTTSSVAIVQYPLLEYLRSSTASVTELGIECAKIPAELCDCLHLIADAIAVNQSITKLRLDLDVEDVGSVDLMKAILGKLSLRYPIGISVLELFCSSEDDLEFIALLQEILPLFFQSLVANLKELILSYLDVNRECVELLLATLQLPGIRRPEKIVFASCEFNEEASVLFGTMMRSETISNSGVGSVVGAVEVVVRTDEPYVYRQDLPPCLLDYFVIPCNGRIRVRELDLPWKPRWHVPLLACYLPKALHLRKLDLFRPPDSWRDYEARLREACASIAPAGFVQLGRSKRRHQLLNAKRQNGSLHEFILSDDALLESPALKRKLEAYLTRNRELPQLLSRPCLDNDNEKKTATTTTTTTTTSSTSPVVPTVPKTDLTVFPPLLVAATASPALSPNNILIGLSAAAEGMGDLL